MIKIKNLIEELKKFPENSFAYPYEADIIGIIIVDSTTLKAIELGYILCSDSDDESHKTIIYGEKLN